MRTIEFRGYNLKNEVWLYGHYFVNRGRHFIVTGDVLDNPLSTPEDFEIAIESLGQYTGLKDKNGVKIYEVDIIQYTSGRSGVYSLPDHIGELIWAGVGYSISDPLGRTYDIDLWDADELEVDLLDHCTIIGNTYEHPNLLQ